MYGKEMLESMQNVLIVIGESCVLKRKWKWFDEGPFADVCAGWGNGAYR